MRYSENASAAPIMGLRRFGVCVLAQFQQKVHGGIQRQAEVPHDEAAKAAAEASSAPLWRGSPSR